MTESRLVGLVFEAWKDFDRATANLAPAEAVRRSAGESSIAWTVAHVSFQLDGWVNVRIQGLAPHELIGDRRFNIGGTGEVDDWPTIRRAVGEVRETARRFLEPLTDSALSRVIPYEGSFSLIRERGLSLQHALLRIAAHHYFHLGEIASLRTRRGDQIGDYPGLLEETI